MTDFPDDDLVARLRALGERPVDPVVAADHLTAMARVVGARHGARRTRFGRAKVAAAFVAGLVLGGTSLASAGVMGDGVQNAVADAAAKVNVNLPGGTPRSTDGCGGITAKNHGDFVRQGGDPKANCGKPTKAVENKADAGADTEADEGSACKPPWAGKGLTKDERKAAKAANPNWTPDPAQCAAEPDVESDGDEPGGRGAEHGNPPATTGTVSSQGADVTPPAGGADANAGVPGGGATPPADDPADDIRPDEPGEPATPPVSVPGPADDAATTATVSS
jgi:hypothetical protein